MPLLKMEKRLVLRQMPGTHVCLPEYRLRKMRNQKPLTRIGTN
jgi:hypothetical protein